MSEIGEAAIFAFDDIEAGHEEEKRTERYDFTCRGRRRSRNLHIPARTDNDEEKVGNRLHRICSSVLQECRCLYLIMLKQSFLVLFDFATSHRSAGLIAGVAREVH